MKVMNDRIISVPIPDDNIAKRVNTLPRNETNCGIVTVRLKRRMKMKNYHNIGNINIDRLFDCLDYLVKNHPAYKDIKIKSKEEWMRNYERSIDDGYSDKDKDIEDCSENEKDGNEETEETVDAKKNPDEAESNDFNAHTCLYPREPASNIIVNHSNNKARDTLETLGAQDTPRTVK